MCRRRFKHGINRVPVDPKKPSGEHFGAYIDRLNVKVLSDIFGRPYIPPVSPGTNKPTPGKKSNKKSDWLTRKNVALFGLTLLVGCLAYEYLWQADDEATDEAAARAA